jgi:hypothetical protein
VYNKKGGATTGENRDLATDAQSSPGRTAIFWLLLAGIAAAAGTMEVRSVLDETQTWDEGIHISAGYSYLTLGDYSWNTEHPPLVKLLCALPLTWMGLKAERYTPDGRLKDQIQYGKDFLYENRKHADTILFAARAPNIALTLMFLVGLGWWVRRRWGAIAGLIAAALCAFDPNLIAHGRYVTTDYPLTVFFFFACVLWAEYLDIGGLRRLLIASVAIAVAMVVKFSALLLIPPLALLYALCWIRRPAEFGVKRTLVAGTAVIACTAVMVAVVYWPETMRCLTGKMKPLAEVVPPGNFIGNSLVWAGRRFHLPAHAFLTGLGRVSEHNAGGHPTYLMGLRSNTGFWYYFPVVFAVKSTMAALAATLIVTAAGTWIVWKRRASAVTPIAMGLVLPPLLYFIFSMSSAINLGMRHILPIYPFLYVGLAALLAGAAGGRLRGLGIACAAMLAMLQIAECASIHPDYLAFFNAPAGGPGRGAEYLVDSNIDWGQDLKKLARWLNVHGKKQANLYYFGNAIPAYYGIKDLGMPGAMNQQEWDNLDDYMVANVTSLNGVYAPLIGLAPVRLRDPVAKIGWSMYVYDFRKKK